MRELNQDELRYFVTDYFDEIKVDTLDMEKASLQQCMGIMPKANIKKGVSHQRYCLYSDSKEENIIWDRNPDWNVSLMKKNTVLMNGSKHPPAYGFYSL